MNKGNHSSMKRLSAVIENARISLYVRAMSEADNGRDGRHIELLHTHSYFEFFAVTGSPIGLFFTEGEQKLSIGDIIIVPPNFPHTRHTYSEPSGSCFAAGISIEKLDIPCEHDLISELRPLFGISLPKRISGSAEEAEELRKIFMSTEDDDGLLLMLRLTVLLKKLSLRASENISLPNRGTDGGGSCADLWRIILLESIIRQDFARGLTAGSIAKALNVSRRQLDRDAKQRYGKTVSELIRERRLEYAEELLTETSMPVERIAEEAGLGDGDSLCRAIKAKHGTTPGALRRARAKYFE